PSSPLPAAAGKEAAAPRSRSHFLIFPVPDPDGLDPDVDLVVDAEVEGETERPLVRLQLSNGLALLRRERVMCSCGLRLLVVVEEVIWGPTVDEESNDALPVILPLLARAALRVPLAGGESN